eukprot:COSAG06_NODE_8535_length_2136_cov_8.001473_1_plen_63_part_00
MACVVAQLPASRAASSRHEALRLQLRAQPQRLRSASTQGANDLYQNQNQIYSLEQYKTRLMH